MIRRNFLRTLLCGPLIVKEAVENNIAEEMSLDISGLKQTSSLISGGPECITNKSQVLTYLKTFGLPQYEDEKILQECKYVRDLDPDIACKKSWSLNVKIVSQRERNRKERVNSVIKGLEHSLARDLFEKTTGWSHWF